MQRLHLEEERLVHERLFGRCNHDSWHQFTDRFDTKLLVCDHCGDEFFYEQGGEHFLSRRKQELSPSDFMRQSIPSYAATDVLVAVVLRQVEAGGWGVMVKKVGTQYACEISNAHTVFSAGPHQDRAAAVIRAAAELAKSGLFKVPREA